jgi:hypothetical protein
MIRLNARGAALAFGTIKTVRVAECAVNVVMQIGSMPGGLTHKSVTLFTGKVMPPLRDSASAKSPSFATGP